MYYPKLFLIGCASVLFVFSIFLPAFNLLVDPYQIFNGIELNGINIEKPIAGTKGRFSKSRLLCRKQPDLVFLGSSRSEFIFNPNHLMIKEISKNAYSYTLAGTGVDEIEKSIRHAYYSSNTKNFIVGLDFHMFNAYREDRLYQTYITDFELSNLVLSEFDSCFNKFSNILTQVLFTESAVNDSIKTIKWQHELKEAKMDALYYNSGQRSSEFMTRVILNGDSPHNLSFNGQALAYMEHVWFPKPENRYCFASEYSSTLVKFNSIVQFAREKNIKIIFVLTPEHAYLQLALRKAGLWNDYLLWRKELVNIIYSKDKNMNSNNLIKIFDFSDLNTITKEKLTPNNIQAKVMHMKWWFEATHSQPAVGDLIIEKIFQTSHQSSLILKNFGIELNNENIESVINKHDLDMNSYELSHKDEVLNISELYDSLKLNNIRENRDYCDHQQINRKIFKTKLIEKEINLDAAKIYQQQADIYRKEKKYKNALLAYDQAIEVSIPNTALYFLRGTLKLEMKDYLGAKKDFEEALTLEPDNLTLKELLNQSNFFLKD